MRIDPILFQILSDLLINLAAGWFGAAIIVPLNVKRSKFRLMPFLINVFSAKIALIGAFTLRKLVV